MRALVRLAPEITTKAPKTRNRFVRTLIDNLKAAFRAAGYQVRVERDYSRIYLDFEEPEVLAVARRVFGIHSISPCRIESFESLEGTVARGRSLMEERVRGRRFAVRARVRDSATGLTSQMVNERLGAALAEIGRVDLDDPEITVRLEIRDGRIVFFTDSIPAEGGIPLGEGGRAVVLLSAGFDSAVAAHAMMRRGVMVEFVSCRLGGTAHSAAVARVANRLVEQWMPGLTSRLWVVPFEELVEQLRGAVEERYRQLVLKRLMYRTAEEVAGRIRGDAIVTGEALGQVSSQTLRNLRALSARTQIPVMRPLLTASKEEIVARAKRVGTQHLSSGVPEYCALGTKPATAARARDVHEQEDRLSFDARRAVDEAMVMSLPTAVVEDVSVQSIERVPEGGVVLDLRGQPARQRRPLPDARVIDPIELLRQPDVLETAREYVVVCENGARSDWFVRELRQLGFSACKLVL